MVDTLALTNAPLFDVQSLLESSSARYLALVGARGINVVQLPHKWGRNNLYEAGKSPILCRFFVCNQKILLLDVCWHPASEDEKHIVLLTNDNCLRIYDINEPHIAYQEIKLIETIDSIGKNVFSAFASSLGETAVSFDFGLPLPKNNYKSNEDDLSLEVTRNDCLWPIYVLKGNGDVLVVYTHLENTYLSQRVLGPLTMLPPAEDNYGVDACRLICLNCLPPLIVIATSSGILYHCLALNNEDECNSHSIPSVLPKPTLFVYESVELTLSLTSIDDEVLCPIRMYKDPLNPERYFCSHTAGIHAISLPLVKRLLTKRLSLENIDQSIVEHLICTKPIATNDESDLVPFGVQVILFKGQSHIQVLLSSGDIITQRLSLWITSKSETFDQIESETCLHPKVEFSDYIGEIMKRNTSAPLLKSSSDKVCSQEKSLQLLLSSTEVFRKEYLAKMSIAATAIERRVKQLKAEKDLQLEELQKCEVEKNNLMSEVTQLTDKYDSILEKQSELSTRLDQVLEKLQSRQTELSEAEIQMLRDLRNMNEKIAVYQTQVEKVKLKFKYQQEIEPLNEAESVAKSVTRNVETAKYSKIQIKNITNIINKE
ncbi:nuclear pore complex protein Nup88-like protein [Dinothrombium tinctorium]|uniref:Nuclear pore complex protein Nup88-like protein n=1 Tax=Dinothrombium tinctorium TaxID=1965070 RepID=A0A3S3QC56_9ACAR|nr:nuclear pore complex protein Nup88-like protein [Dinothrombium tinctorium]